MRVFSFWEDAGLAAAAAVVEVVAVVAGATGFLLAARGTATGGAGADGAPRASLSSSYSFHSSTWSRSYAWFISYKLSFCRMVQGKDTHSNDIALLHQQR